MATGEVVNVSPGGVLTIWSRDHGRFRFFASPIRNLGLLSGAVVEFEPTSTRDLMKIGIVGVGSRVPVQKILPLMEAMDRGLSEASGARSYTPLKVPESAQAGIAVAAGHVFELARGDDQALSQLIAGLEH